VRLHDTGEECLLWIAGGHIICGQVEHSQSVLLFCTPEACHLPALKLTDSISRKHMKLRYKNVTMKQLFCTQYI